MGGKNIMVTFSVLSPFVHSELSQAGSTLALVCL